MMSKDPFAQIHEYLRRSDFIGAFNTARYYADSGSYDAKKLLASMFLHGQGVDADIETARKLFLDLIEVDRSGEVEYNLGYICFICREYNEAIRYYEHSIEKGYLASYCRLAALYRRGYGSEISDARIYELYDVASKKGHVIALRLKSVMMMRGVNGVFGFFQGVFILTYAILKSIYFRLFDRDSKFIQF